MGASSCVVYYGLRFEISPNDIESLEVRTDSRIVAARQARLNFYWGNFGGLEERYLLFVGAEIGVFGPENQLEVQLDDEPFNALATSVRKKLAETGLTGNAALHVCWEEDV